MTTAPTRDELLTEKAELDKQLLDFRKAAYAMEQARIRKQHRGDHHKSLAAWLSRRSQMDEHRSRIVRRMMEIQQQLREMKGSEPKPTSLPPLSEREVVDAKLVFLKLNEILADIRKMKEWMGLDLNEEAEAVNG